MNIFKRTWIRLKTRWKRPMKKHYILISKISNIFVVLFGIIEPITTELIDGLSSSNIELPDMINRIKNYIVALALIIRVTTKLSVDWKNTSFDEEKQHGEPLEK